MYSLGSSFACKEIKSIGLFRKVGSYAPISIFSDTVHMFFFITSEINVAMDTSGEMKGGPGRRKRTWTWK